MGRMTERIRRRNGNERKRREENGKKKSVNEKKRSEKKGKRRKKNVNAPRKSEFEKSARKLNVSKKKNPRTLLHRHPISMTPTYPNRSENGWNERNPDDRACYAVRDRKRLKLNVWSSNENVKRRGPIPKL